MRVWGTCDGAEITFAPALGRWTATVPGAAGEYVIELYAEDDAGNTAYLATLLLTYDPSKLCAVFKITTIAAGWTMAQVRSVLMPQTQAAPDIRRVDVSGGMADVSVSVVRCESCGR